MVLVYFRRNEKPLRSQRKKKKEMPPVLSTRRKRYSDTEHDRVVEQKKGEGGIRFTKAADLRCLAFVFARSASFLPPPPTNILRIERQVATEFRRNNATFGRSCFSCNPAPCFSTCSSYLQPLMGSVCNRILMRRFSLCIPFDYHDRSKRSCFPSFKGDKGRRQSFETAASITVPIIKILPWRCSISEKIKFQV